jgi:hypothetical protein
MVIAQPRGFKMRLNTLLAAAAIAAMTAGAAAAQSMAAPSGSDTTSAPSANAAPMDTSAAPAMAAPSADQNGTPAAATMPGQTVESSPTPAANAYTLKAGDPNVVSNAPIPDTRANRAQFGKPMSNAGRRTAAAGN